MKSNLTIVLEAACFDADRHRHQRRKDADASPYINHPLALTDILAHEGGVDDAETIAAALLHDVVESLIRADVSDASARALEPGCKP